MVSISHNNPPASRNELIEFLGKNGLRYRRSLGSKSTYRSLFPNHRFIPNAMLFSKHEYVWTGDLDLRNDQEILEEAADQFDMPLWIVWESQADPQKQDAKTAIECAVWQTGGVRPSVWRSIFLSSGLSLDDFTRLVFRTEAELDKPHAPEYALQWDRRFRGLDRACRMLQPNESFGWGAWWLQRMSSGQTWLDFFVQSKGSLDSPEFPMPMDLQFLLFWKAAWRPIMKEFPWW